MAIRGQRFRIDLSDDETHTTKPAEPVFTSSRTLGLVADIKERSPSAPKPPSPPKIGSSGSGFPAHKRRAQTTTFKQARANQPPKASQQQRTTWSDSRSHASSHDTGQGALHSAHAENNLKNAIDEGRGIDEENRQRIAQMTTEEIEDARKELFTGLSPSLIERLLKKANIDEESENPDIYSQASDPRNMNPSAEKHSKRVTSNTASSRSSHTQISPLPSRHSDPDLPPTVPPPDLIPASSTPIPPQLPADLPSPPVLDPSSPTFLSSLRETYFPSLPSSPTSLSWLTPPTPSESSYSSHLASLPPSSLRFDFRGHLLPPRLAAQIPLTKGLHHHGLAPESAGYTIPELARLARSSFAAQRCVAFQTLGRVLYRLGRGDFGPHDEELADGLWTLVDQGQVLDLLVQAAARDQGGSRTCWVTATEAVWLWRKGGGKRWKAG